MRRLSLVGAATGLLASLLACPDEPIFQIPAPDDQIDIFNQKGAAQVDILWVIDNSESMLAEQEKVSSRFADFFTQLLTSQVNYHIGVITTDPANAGVLRAYNGPEVAGCGADCRFLTPDVGCTNPGVITAGLNDTEVDQKLLDECQAQLVFRKLISAGIDGSAFEEGFTQAAIALGVNDIDPATGAPLNNPPAENAGFLRPEATLYIIFVSDEDEGAKADGAPVRYYQRLFESLKGAGNERKVSVSAIVGWPLEDGAVPLSDVCPILETTFDNNPSTDDARAAEVRDAMTQRTGCVDQAGTGQAGDQAETGSRYVELACRTGGVVTNMCEADYSTSLDALGANAAGLLRKFPLSRAEDIEAGNDGILFTDDDDNLDCDEDGAQDGVDDGPLCVYGLDIGESGEPHLIPRNATNGWTWEESTNAVRFNGAFIPAPGSTLEIRYKVKPGTGAAQ